MCFKVNSVLSESGPFNVLNPKVADMFVLSPRERERERERERVTKKRQKDREKEIEVGLRILCFFGGSRNIDNQIKCR
jgi:hypothetical protein